MSTTNNQQFTRRTVSAVTGAALALFLVYVPGVFAQHIPDLDYAQVLNAVATEQRDGLWRFDVTVEHNDTGWDHYADAWQVLDNATGDVRGERTLLHPHVNEMPFTRSLSGVVIPAGVTEVRIRARCNVHGYGGREMVITLRE